MSPELASNPSRTMLVPAVVRAIAVLDLLEKECRPMSLAKLATDLSLPKSSMHGLCNTLTMLGYLRRQDDGGFFIGPRVLGLAHAFAAQTSPAREFEQWWSDAGHAVHDTMVLSTLDGIDVVDVALRNGRQPLGLALGVGLRLPAYRVAAGLAMLAFQSEARVKRLFPAPWLPPFMNLPSMRRADLLAKLELTQARGYAIDDEGTRQGVYCLAAPVFGAAGEVVAGLSLYLPKASLKPKRLAQHGKGVIDMAQQLSQRLGAPVMQPGRNARAKAAKAIAAPSAGKPS